MIITDSIKEEMRRLLENWARWAAGGRGGTLSPFPAYNLAPPGKRGELSIPILILDAEDVDVALRAMPGYYRKILLGDYFWVGTAETKAKRMKLSRATWYRRVNEAQEIFWDRWTKRVEYAQRLAQTRIKSSTDRISSMEDESA